MFYTYVIQSLKNNSFYIGSTNNLKERFKQHNEGRSKYTSIYKPWSLVYYEAFQTYKLAFRRELQLKKRGKAWQELCKRLDVKR